MDQHEVLTAVRLIQQETKHITELLDKQYKSIETIRESYATKKDLEHLEAKIKLAYDPTKEAVKRLNWLIVSSVVLAILGLVLTKM